LNNIYYVYAYLRSKDSTTAKAGTPYYIGKGVHNRAWEQHRRNNKGVHTPKDKSNIVILEQNLTDRQAKDLEIELIAKYGRKDINTGILENRTIGGEGSIGWIITDEIRAKKSASMIGKNVGKIRDNDFRAAISKFQTGRPKPTRSIEHCTKLSVAKTGILQKQVSCPHCGKTGGANAMTRYHFDNCKI
jgi:hypothetical protein